MSNVKNMIRWEFLLLYRYKIIHISILSVVLYFLTTQAISSLQGQMQVHSTLLFFDPAVIGFVFVGALVLFEKSENVLQALVITPMRIDEYLQSKLLSLTLLSLVSASLFLGLMAVFSGTEVNVVYFIVGIILTSIMLILLGFIIVSRVDSVNGYLLGIMIGFLALSFPPLLHIFGLFESLGFYLWPTMASLIILENVFTSGGYETWELAYGVIYQIIWIGILYVVAKKAFREFIIVRGG